MNDEMITITEYARQHGISPATMRQRIARGRHPEAVKIGRDWLIPKDAELIDNRAEGRSTRWSDK